MTSTSRRASVASLVFVLAAVATACGTAASDDRGSAAPASTSSPTSPSTSVPTSSSPSTAAGPTAAASGPSSSPSTPDLEPGTRRITMTVDGLERTATVAVPKDTSTPAPLVFAFHGHGGSGANFDRKLQIEQRWPEAIVIYPDGLVGHKGKTDPEGVKPGWQTAVGEDGDRDLHFYDALLAQAQSRLRIDPDRIYVMGHSNGSAFTSLVLNQRGDKIAATANMSAQPGALLATDPVRSMYMMMGEKDPIVPIEGQKRSIPLAEQKLMVDPATAKVDGYQTSEIGPGHHELVTYIHPAGHEVPDAVPPLVVDFFKRHTLSNG